MTLEEDYEQRRPALEQASHKLASILAEVVAAIEDKTLVRADVRSVRLKSLSSIERKAAVRGWKAHEALLACSDLIGGRVVCNNIEDVYRFAELLKEHLPIAPGWFEIEDHIKTPIKGGYRALHVNLRLTIAGGLFFEFVPCEVQIRSRLQDAWAELSHDDVYQQPDLPEDLRERAKDLAAVLAAADRIASRIRTRVTRESIPPEQRPDLRRVSRDGLVFLFKETFGRSAADYVIRRALNLCAELGVKSLEKLPAILGRDEFRGKIADAYQAIMPGPIVAEDTFLASLYALVRGEARAINKVRRDARREWREIDQFAHREMMADLPDKFDDLLEQLESPGEAVDIEGWAEALETTNRCNICGTKIVDPYAFAEAALSHYDAGDENGNLHERIETAIRRSSTETGGRGDGSLCAYHNEGILKD
jgi:ppGpp synthetase/RelA/SpoT-type nucleotidyltranferase